MFIYVYNPYSAHIYTVQYIKNGRCIPRRVVCRYASSSSVMSANFPYICYAPGDFISTVHTY